MARIRPSHLGDQLGSLGDFIGTQRRAAELTLRQLAEQTGVSNPYLSQIERGLRKPSAEVLQQLSKALRVSAETLYVRAGILDPQDHPVTTVEMALLGDSSITERQRRVLMDVYSSFVKENEQSPASAADATEPPVTEDHIVDAVLVDIGPDEIGPDDIGPDDIGPDDIGPGDAVLPDLTGAVPADPDFPDPDFPDAGSAGVIPTAPDPLDR